MANCKVIAVANQKGGVGKSTSVYCIGAGLAMDGKRVLLVDVDPQGDLTKMLGQRKPHELPHTLAEQMNAVVQNKTEPEHPEILHHHEGFDFVPANRSLSAVEVGLVNEAEGVGKARTQKVDIYFNYVGQVDIAYTEEELAEIKAQEEQIEAERLAKQREREKAYREKRKAKKLAENGGEIVKTKVCPHCQKEFIPTSNRQIFCSKDCCYQARQDKTKADREAEKGNHYYRQRVCAVCGSTYWPTHSQQKLCSEECQKQNHNEKSLEFYHKKQKEKSKCNDLSQMKEPVSSTNSSEIITIPA